MYPLTPLDSYCILCVYIDIIW